MLNRGRNIFNKAPAFEMPVEEQKPAVLHRLPCTIKHNGPANVDEYFKPKGK